ncbi:unnamed protein product [Paramecium pentaurelia]|uniref:Uncharacterized protein n=1 Tax=Paramecium pentaurelia TaxID=43138 RepID=A0A8S1Y5L3_9CILI|nr:unnamed protein product [Paramecium pentaurelia]
MKTDERMKKSMRKEDIQEILKKETIPQEVTEEEIQYLKELFLEIAKAIQLLKAQ